MENIVPGILVLIVIGGFFFLIGYVIFQVVRYRYWYSVKNIDPKSKNTLERYFLYYRNLPKSLKKKFENRTILFIRSKDWFGQDGLEITPEMKILVAATAVQITFGFKFYQLPRFSKIFIYPKAYFNEQTKNYHKGEVHPMGRIIKLSWDNFLKGFGNPEDGINLGLHEMTHAMSLENRFTSNGVSGFIAPYAHKVWLKEAALEINTIKSTSNSIFRKYAATNMEEFLAVSVEVFFEQTQQFQAYNPELYKATCNLLGQDPLPRKLVKPHKI